MFQQRKQEKQTTEKIKASCCLLQSMITSLFRKQQTQKYKLDRHEDTKCVQDPFSCLQPCVDQDWTNVQFLCRHFAPSVQRNWPDLTWFFAKYFQQIPCLAPRTSFRFQCWTVVQLEIYVRELWLTRFFLMQNISFDQSSGNVKKQMNSHVVHSICQHWSYWY